MAQQRILLVEDDGVTRLMLEMQIQKASHIVVGVASGEQAIAILAQERFDLLVTDLRMPTMDGMQVMEAARAIDPQIEVIILTGAACTNSAIAAVNHHAHSYMLKPVRCDDLIRNVAEALSHRCQIAEQAPTYNADHAGQASAHVLHIGPLRIDFYRHRVTHGDQALSLTRSEFSLLMYLAQRRGTVVSAVEIAREVLRHPCSPQEARDLTKGHIHRLRRKITPPPLAARLIHSVRGTGYRLADDDELM
ncbi:MAG: response regulator transcription factor [Chloroflexales bacterium]